MDIYKKIAAVVMLAASCAVPATALAGIQSVYYCSLKDGASFEQLMKFEKAYVAELKKLKGAEKFSVSILTPIAAQAMQGADFIWAGNIPDWESYAAMSDAYTNSKAIEKYAMEFVGMASCNSSSIWHSTVVE